jgi:hypothetical protein
MRRKNKMMVQKLGDGQNICSKHWRKEFEGPEPTYGWVSGECDWCKRSEAAAALGKKGGSAKTEKKAAASRENGKKGGRPRKVQEEQK